MKKTVCIFLTALIAITALTGCQETPDSSIVVGKDTSKMLEKAMASQDVQGSLSEILGITSDHYETSFKDQGGNINVTVDADIDLPDTDRIPIIRVAADSFSQNTVNKVIDALFDDGPLYDPESLSELTKTDIVDLLAQLKQKKAELEAQGMESEKSDSAVSDNDGSSNEKEASSLSMNQLDQVIENIALYEQLLETAPDEKTYTEVSGELETQDISGMCKENQAEFQGKLYEIGHIGQLNAEGGMSSLFVLNNEQSNHYLIQYINRGDYEMTTGHYYTEEQWNGMEDEPDRAETDALAYPVMTEDEAKTVAGQFLEQIGIDYLDCKLVEKVIVSPSREYAGGVRTGNLLKAYRLQYVRKVDGVPVTYTNVESSWDDSDTSNVWTWDYERMTLIIDDSGIVEMIWNAPYELKETITETTTMLPFFKIQNIFEKMIIVINADYSEYGMEMSITDVRLGLARITEQNNLKSGLLIPVWDFFGTVTYHYENKESDAYPGTSFLTINAIDGSIIDRKQGY